MIPKYLVGPVAVLILACSADEAASPCPPSTEFVRTSSVAVPAPSQSQSPLANIVVRQERSSGTAPAGCSAPGLRVVVESSHAHPSTSTYDLRLMMTTRTGKPWSLDLHVERGATGTLVRLAVPLDESLDSGSLSAASANWVVHVPTPGA